MKVFVHKKTKEFGHYMGKGEFATSSTPQIFPDSMNEEEFRTYVKSQEDCDLYMDDYEIKNIKIVITDE